MNYEPGNFIYINRSTYKYSICELPVKGHETLVFLITLATNLFGIWLPMVIIVIVHILLFRKLRKQARVRRHHISSTHKAPSQLQSISKRFIVIVCAFFLCMLPGTVIQTYFAYLMYSETEKQYNDLYVSFFRSAVQISTSIMNINSCLNPFIYSKSKLNFLKRTSLPWKHVRSYLDVMSSTKERLNRTQNKQKFCKTHTTEIELDKSKVKNDNRSNITGYHNLNANSEDKVESSNSSHVVKPNDGGDSELPEPNLDAQQPARECNGYNGENKTTEF